MKNNLKYFTKTLAHNMPVCIYLQRQGNNETRHHEVVNQKRNRKPRAGMISQDMRVVAAWI